MPKKFFITTAIDYTNSPPHIGHAYEKILTDIVEMSFRSVSEMALTVMRFQAAFWPADKERI
jgi:methionyl-tRNA synthetase